jgi:DNA-binding response OmpR family regulator
MTMNNDRTSILLIEDHAGDARMVQEAFREHDAAVKLVHCPSLGEAIRYLERERVDLVFLDLGLPDASGLQALSELDCVSPRTPVIVLTGLDDEIVALQALRRGAQDHLFKGDLTAQTLMRSMRYALERQRTVNLRSDLLKGIARELASPVEVLVASLQLLLANDGPSLTERQAKMLERVFNTVETLRRFRDGMLDLARDDEGPLRYQVSRLGGACVIEEIKRRMATGLHAIEGEGAAPAHAFADKSLVVEETGEPQLPTAADQPLRMLLIEDNPGDARLVAEILSEMGAPCELETSVCLTDAVRRLENTSYDVILVDLGLPDASALEAVSEVVRLAARSSVVVLTGRDDDAAAATALKKGAQDYLIKGQVDASVLSRSIRFARERQRTINLRAELLEAVADELCNPIHVVLGYVHLLLEMIPDPLTPQQAETLGDVLSAACTLRRLRTAMLEFAGAEQGPQREELRNAGAAQVIEDIKRRMAHLLVISPEGETPRPPLPQFEVKGVKPGVPGRLFRRLLRRFGKQPKQILVVDPDFDSRTIIRAALESGAFDVVEATKEQEVLDHLVSDKIAVAVFERRTPGLAAPEIFQHVRKVAAYCDIPMVVVDTEQNGSRPELPAFCMSKPFTPEQLLFAVDHVLGRA